MRKTETYFTCDGCEARKDEVKMLHLSPNDMHGIGLGEQGQIRLAYLRKVGRHGSFAESMGTHVCLACQAKLLHHALGLVEAQLEKERLRVAVDKAKRYLETPCHEDMAAKTHLQIGRNE